MCSNFTAFLRPNLLSELQVPHLGNKLSQESPGSQIMWLEAPHDLSSTLPVLGLLLLKGNVQSEC